MARAAAKRNQGTRATSRGVAADQKEARKHAEKSLEDQLFFNRLRNHAKWVFVLLAIVFASSFVFLGVGTGNAGLGDVFSSVLGTSGSSIEELQQKVAENPKARQAVVDLAVALERDGRTDEAIAAYRTFLQSNPKDEDVLANLAILYQTKAAIAGNALNLALRDVSLASPGAQFRPGSGNLGDALGSFIDPLGQAASSAAERRYQEALAAYQAASDDVLRIYRSLSRVSPNDSSALLRYAQAAESAQQPKVALAAYQDFVRRFPDDSLARDARVRITELKKEIAAQGATIDLPDLTGQTG